MTGLSGAFDMPKRTTPKQEVIALLRLLLAKEGCAITESAMLQDARTGLRREVDVVMECDIGDVQVTVSFEVIDHKRKADIIWVEQMLKKHEALPTDKLVLISWSGFSANARMFAGTEPNVLLIEVQESGQAKRLYMDSVALTIEKVFVTIRTPAGEAVRTLIEPETGLFDSSGAERPGAAFRLASEWLNQPPVVRKVLVDAHSHPERDRVKWFVVSGPIGINGLHLRHEESGELHPITAIEIAGPITWTQRPLDLTITRFGDVLFGHQGTEVLGRRTLTVATFDEQGELSGLSARVYGKANREGRPAESS
jgi:hypothetical protein